MPRLLAGSRPDVDDAWRAVVFNINDARRALPYVARVARDAAEAFQQAQQFRCALLCHVTSRERALLSDLRDAALNRLNCTIDECNAVGADLLDIPLGVVRFPVDVNGRRISLNWRLGEPVENAWPSIVDDEQNNLLHAAAR